MGSSPDACDTVFEVPVSEAGLLAGAAEELSPPPQAARLTAIASAKISDKTFFMFSASLSFLYSMEPPRRAQGVPAYHITACPAAAFFPAAERTPKICVDLSPF